MLFISMKSILFSNSWKYTKKYFSYKNYLSILWNCVHLTYSHDGRMCVELSKGFTMYHPWKKKKKVFRIIGTKRDGGKGDESKGKDGQNMINFSAF